MWVYIAVVKWEIPRGCFFNTKNETMEFDIFIIIQIVYVIVTFKLIISSFSNGYIGHLSLPTSFKC